jgi:enoyl-CoA hydratase
MRIAANDARFALPETGLGFIPGAGATQLLPRVIGEAKSLHMIITGVWLNANQAFDCGLVDQIVSREDLARTSQERADLIASYPAISTRYIKEAVIRGASLTLQQSIQIERHLANVTFTKASYSKIQS